MKTVFIVITRGFLVRNILRSGVLDYLKKDNLKVVVFLLGHRTQAVPESMKDEFRSYDLSFESVYEPNYGFLYRKVYRLFCRLTSLLIYTQSTCSYMRMGNTHNLNRRKIWLIIDKFTLVILSKLNFLKSLIRWIDFNIFRNDMRFYSKYFNKYNPDLVFSTSIISKVDIGFLKEAKRRKIKTVSMTKGWDHIAKVLFRFVPDKLVVQNEVLKFGAIKYQKIPDNKIEICGFPNFDWYRRPDILLSREKFFSLLGLDPSRRLIFFGSEGHWAPDDDKIVDDLVGFLKSNLLIKPVSLLIRPHFTDFKKGRFDRFRGLTNVKVDDNITRCDYFHDGWDPSIAETKMFVNSIYHSDIMITVASTLALDACCFDKPIITVAYNALFDPRTKEDISPFLYQTDHYDEVLNTGAVDLVYNKEEMAKKINNYFKNPNYKLEERKILQNKLCNKVDGQASNRIANVILNYLNKS